MRKLASVVVIETCEPIPSTDRLSVAKMVGKGWNVVTGRDEFVPGELAVYFEIDSFLPSDDPRYAFLRDRCLRKFVSKSGMVLREGIRIKTCKLRGVVSQGLLMKLDKFCGMEIQCVARQATDADMTCNGHPVAEGFDLTEALRIEHYDEVAEQLRPATGGSNPVSSDAYGPFPSVWVPRTDEERIQNLTGWFGKFKGMKWQITEKQDGSSCTMAYSPTIDSQNPFMVCSRNLRLKPENAQCAVPVMWQLARRYDVERKLRDLYDQEQSEIALQGEALGPGINQDRDRFQEYEWHVFKAWDVRAQQYLFPQECVALCKRLDIPHVPVLGESVDVFCEYPDCDALLKLAEGKTVRGNEREGLVFKSEEVRGMSFKAVSNRYLLKDAT